MKMILAVLAGMVAVGAVAQEEIQGEGVEVGFDLLDFIAQRPVQSSVAALGAGGAGYWLASRGGGGGGGGGTKLPPSTYGDDASATFVIGSPGAVTVVGTTNDDTSTQNWDLEPDQSTDVQRGFWRALRRSVRVNGVKAGNSRERRIEVRRAREKARAARRAARSKRRERR